MKKILIHIEQGGKSIDYLMTPEEANSKVGAEVMRASMNFLYENLNEEGKKELFISINRIIVE